MKSIYHDPDLQRGKDNRKWFENVKLVGEINKGTSIYIEDYAYTYLHQCASYDLSYELCAVLIGEHDVELEQMVIYGAMFVDLEGVSADSKWLDQGVLDGMEADIKYYFPKGKCLGWMHTQPGYGIMATIQEMAVHREIFDGDSLLMLIDPVDGQEAFFICEEGQFDHKQGFCIYYEKNEQMQRHMEDYPMGEAKKEMEVDKLAGEFRELGAKRKKKVEEEKKRNKLIGIMVAGTLLTTAFVMGKYSQRSAINELEKEVVKIQDEYSEAGNRLSDHPVELVFTSPQLEAKEEPEVAAEPEPEVKPEVDVEPEPPVEAEVVIEPEVKPEVKLQPEYDIHVVEMGDSLLRLSYNYYKTVGKAKQIAEFNGIKDYDTIYIGQELKIPNLR